MKVWWHIVDVVDDVEHCHVALGFAFALVDRIHRAFQRVDGLVQRNVVVVFLVRVFQNVVQQEYDGGKTL